MTMYRAIISCLAALLIGYTSYWVSIGSTPTESTGFLCSTPEDVHWACVSSQLGPIHLQTPASLCLNMKSATVRIGNLHVLKYSENGTVSPIGFVLTHTAARCIYDPDEANLAVSTLESLDMPDEVGRDPRQQLVFGVSCRSRPNEQSIHRIEVILDELPDISFEVLKRYCPKRVAFVDIRQLPEPNRAVAYKYVIPTAFRLQLESKFNVSFSTLAGNFDNYTSSIELG